MWCYHPFIQRNKARFEKRVRGGGGGGVFIKLVDQEPSANQVYFRKLVLQYTFTEKVLFSCIREFFVNICFRCFRYLNFLDPWPRPEGSYKIGCLSVQPSIHPSIHAFSETYHGVRGADIVCKTEPDFLEKIPIRH